MASDYHDRVDSSGHISSEDTPYSYGKYARKEHGRPESASCHYGFLLCVGFKRWSLIKARWINTSWKKHRYQANYFCVVLTIPSRKTIRSWRSEPAVWKRSPIPISWVHFSKAANISACTGIQLRRPPSALTYSCCPLEKAKTSSPNFPGSGVAVRLPHVSAALSRINRQGERHAGVW